VATTYDFDASISSAVTPNGHEAAAVRPLAPMLRDRMLRYWHAANYLTVAQIYLLDNPLLRELLRTEQIKPRLLGHWDTSPGPSLIYVHLNRLINERDANVIYLAGPGHRGPAIVAQAYLEGTYSEVYPEVSQDMAGVLYLCRSITGQAPPDTRDARRR
jgi:xylulose-5-phosphate/fructose-6-phosphate phosphoketolase